jgi:hypothetical protein
MTSALFGGIAGALLSLIVSFMVQERRLRGEVAFKVVDWLQETYRTMEVFMVQRDFRSDEARKSLHDPEVYMQAKMRLREIVGADTIRAQVAMTFGEGDDLRLLNGIQAVVRDIVQKAWTTPGVTRDWLSGRMAEVEQARNELERQLLQKARPPWFLRWA